MAIYVTVEDVQERYLNGSLPEDWVAKQIDDAEELLFDYFPRLETSATEKEVKRIKRVVARAVIRYYDNPRGVIREQIEEQSVTLRSDSGGIDETGLYFTAKELALFRTRRRVGMIGVDPAPFAGRDEV